MGTAKVGTATAIQDDVDAISLAIQECDYQPRAHAAQCALNRLIEKIERLRAENAALLRPAAPEVIDHYKEQASAFGQAIVERLLRGDPPSSDEDARKMWDEAAKNG